MNEAAVAPTSSFPSVQETRVTDAAGAILFDRRLVAQADRALLDPTHWAQRGRMEGSRGGRGAVCFVRGEFGEAVIRHYRRGGLVGRLNRDLYLWTGEPRTRAFREFRLLAELRERGLPVPAPLAAGYSRLGLLYRADLMTLAIPDTRTVAEALKRDGGAELPWAGIGRMLQAFHAEGVFHADLNAHNILVDGAGKPWLIDFDRGALRGPDSRWQARTLQRLQRSLRKLGLDGAAFAEAWQQLGIGYLGAGGEPAALPAA
jgi:3-deoxy-D-manno-octulosonic acid kinase